MEFHSNFAVCPLQVYGKRMQKAFYIGTQL